MELVLVPKPPTLVFLTQVTSPLGLEILQPAGGKLAVVKPSETGGSPGLFTITFTVLGLEVQPAAVTEQEYVPPAAEVADEMTGFCSEELKPLGPVQAKTAPEVVELALSARFSPAQRERLAERENTGTGEPVIQENPDLILAPGWVPKPLVKLIPCDVR